MADATFISFCLTYPALFMHAPVSAESDVPMLTVIKSPTCGCCVKWMDHLHDNGLQRPQTNPITSHEKKNQLGIRPQYRSCHTGVSEQGYVFEGHIPAKFIHEFLASPPDGALGLAYPACRWAAQVWKLATALCRTKCCC